MIFLLIISKLFACRERCLKKFNLHLALVSLIAPFFAHALGLGEMTVHSSLNQPFNAEIELIDIDSIPLTGIQASIASVEDFERVGLERAYVLDLLAFQVGKNTAGKPVLKIRSVERISEPYMEILVDLAWAQGQVYRAYTVLLDPPQYELITVRQTGMPVKSGLKPNLADERGVIQKPVISHVDHASASMSSNRGTETYGPTLANESIWQIAQRYKTPDIILQQMILAIVGTNPEAFTEGNLNGLQAGMKLSIPSNETAKKIPDSLAKLEVYEHDSAWQNKQSINHVLLPPYVDARRAPEKISGGERNAIVQLPSIPQLFSSPTVKSDPDHNKKQHSVLPKAQSFLAAQADAVRPRSDDKIDPQQVKLKAQMDVALTAIESVRETNALLSEQLRLAQADNQRLQQQLAQKEKLIKQLQAQVQVIKTRQGIAGQASTPIDEYESDNPLWPWILLACLVVMGGGGAYWWYWLRIKENPEADEGEAMHHPAPIMPPPPVMEESAATTTTKAETHPKDETLATSFTEESVIPEEPVAAEKTTAEESVSVARLAIEPEPAVEKEVDVQEETAGTAGATGFSAAKSLFETAGEQIEDDHQVEDDHIVEFEAGLRPMAETPLPEEITSIKNDQEKFKEIPMTELELMPLEEPEIEAKEESAVPTLEIEVEEKNNSKPTPAAVLAPQSESTPEVEAAKPMKSARALQTLLDLARTYISMEDFAAARQSLQEVLEYGDLAQKTAAKKLLAELNSK
ncbi:hypothetical protein EKM59_09945 [Legionella septentrionalis]|uniref:FimV N-terminal domain-containing protein n=1 Tax=Legionella septentrionalis TaxID=2498109 RepID=A0A3S0WQT1_9GAMM|nr:hypothetical protein EKM59_09945 [Legionella septentrionalis]